MNKRKSKNIDWDKANTEIEEWMYENNLEDKMIQFGKYHWRISTLKATIDVWHGSRKFWIHGTGGSTLYDSLDELIQYI